MSGSVDTSRRSPHQDHRCRARTGVGARWVAQNATPAGAIIVLLGNTRQYSAERCPAAQADTTCKNQRRRNRRPLEKGVKLFSWKLHQGREGRQFQLIDQRRSRKQKTQACRRRLLNGRRHTWRKPARHKSSTLVAATRERQPRLKMVSMAPARSWPFTGDEAGHPHRKLLLRAGFRSCAVISANHVLPHLPARVRLTGTRAASRHSAVSGGAHAYARIFGTSLLGGGR